ncbi:hypothetical protein Tco_0435688 [Tanacetum coccineum]
MIPQAILMRSRRKTINIAKPKAVHNAVKASTCWVWKPKNRVIDHVSKYNNASITLKRFDYIDAQGRFNSMDAQTQGRHEHDQEFNAEITIIGVEVDDIKCRHGWQFAHKRGTSSSSSSDKISSNYSQDIVKFGHMPPVATHVGNPEDLGAVCLLRGSESESDSHI